MIALASAGATCVRKIFLNTRLGLVRLIRVPRIFSCFPLLDFARTPINAVPVDGRTCFGIAGAPGVVNLPQNNFKINAGSLFGDVRNAVPRNAFFVDMVTFQCALE